MRQFVDVRLTTIMRPKKFHTSEQKKYLPKELRGRLCELWNLSRQGAVHADSGEALTPWATFNDMIIDLLDDVVDVWIDDLDLPMEGETTGS